MVFPNVEQWRKVHLAVNVGIHQIVAHELTKNNVFDGETCNNMALHFQDRVENMYGDGIYDQRKCYENIRRIGGNPIIPIRRNACMQKNFINLAKLPRNNAIAVIRALAKMKMRNNSGKSKTITIRSISETAMFRLKNTFGPILQFKKFENQKVKIAIKIGILNKIRSLSMPKNM